MTEQKLDEVLKEYFSEKEEISPSLKRKISQSLAKSEEGKQRKQFFLLALAVILYSNGIFAVGCGFLGASPAMFWLLINLGLAVTGSSVFSLIVRRQAKMKEA